MKNIHLVASADVLRPAMMHIQVQGGFVKAVDGFAVVKFPVNEVFPENIIAENEELYFLASDWKAAKVGNAFSMTREGNTFYILDKKLKSLGFIKAKTVSEIDFKFPDVESVLPTRLSTLPIDAIAFNPTLFNTVCQVFGDDPLKFKFTFFGANKIIKIQHANWNGEAYVRPCVISDKFSEQ